MITFLSSRYGKVESISIYRYDFNEQLLNEEKRRLIRWLERSNSVQLYDIKENYFLVFEALKESMQYQFRWSKYMSAPFRNTQEISTYLGRCVLKVLASVFKQYHNTNSVVVDNIHLDQFALLKCIKFDVELFSSGRFYIHFFPGSKIISGQKVTKEYIDELRAMLNKTIENVKVSLRISNKSQWITADLSKAEEVVKLKKFIDNNIEDDLFATFNYRSLASLSPTVFGEVQKLTKNLLIGELPFLQTVAQSIKLDMCSLYDKPFFKCVLNQPFTPKNIVVGGNRVVSKQSAAYHFGMFKGIDNTDIRPIFINETGTVVESDFYTKLGLYNKEGKGNLLLSPICIKTNEIDDKFELPVQLTTYSDRKTINAVFSSYQIPDDFFDAMFDANQVFQIYVGPPMKYKLDNFTVKCLAKAGGILNLIHDTKENEHTYFIGIDLGHANDHSIIGLTLYSWKGELLKFQTSKCYHSEALDSVPLKMSIRLLYDHLVAEELPKPRKVIVHRDGKNHVHDIDRLVDSLMLIFDIIQIDIVEVIKSGFPVIGCYVKPNYFLPNSGDYFLDRDEDYAILVTNTQSKDSESGQILKPIVVKRKYGVTNFNTLVEQVFWFTKVYTNNLYQSSRLPATTEKANNVVGTGVKRHLSTYLA